MTDTNPTRVAFGLRVKTLRQAAGLTQRALAERLGRSGKTYHQTTIAKLETGHRGTMIDDLAPLAIALGVTEGDLLIAQSTAPASGAATHAAVEAERILQQAHEDMTQAVTEALQTFEEALLEYSHEVATLLRRNCSAPADDPAQPSPCQVVDPSLVFVCSATESGGLRCENPTLGHGDTEHWISDHTVQHARAGNGYACSAFNHWAPSFPTPTLP